MRWVVTTIAVLAVLGCIAASGFMNWLFMTSLGKTEIERQVFGIVSLGVSGFLSVLPVLIMWAWQSRRILAVVIGFILFVVCASVSLSSAVGFAASNRGETVGDRETVTARFESDQAALAEAEARLKALPPARPTGVVEAEIERQKQDRLWTSSKGCTDATATASRDFCKGIESLRAELASAAEAAPLHVKIDQLRTEIGTLREKGAGREADAQAAIIGRVLGIGTSRAQEGLAMMLAVVVELMAGFGFYLATSHVQVRRPGRPERLERVEQPEVIELTVEASPITRPAVVGGPRRIGQGGHAAQAGGPRRLQIGKSG